MGKAFTDGERAAAREKLRRSGLKLFADKGVKGVSIRDLTAAAGIAQGGFYTFYKDKDDFLADLIALRVKEKLAALSGRNSESLSDPVGFISGIFYSEGMHLKENKAFDNIISGSLSFLYENRADIHQRVGRAYADYLNELAEFWKRNGYKASVDTEGLLNLIRAAGILFSNAALLDDHYFAVIFRRFCEAETDMFLKVEKDDAGMEKTAL